MTNDSIGGSGEFQLTPRTKMTFENTPEGTVMTGIEQAPPWSVRIPAAIAKAEERMGSAAIRQSLDKPFVFLSREEVALAKSLWEAHKLLLGGHEVYKEAWENTDRSAPGHLRAFAEKVESLE